MRILLPIIYSSKKNGLFYSLDLLVLVLSRLAQPPEMVILYVAPTREEEEQDN
jgi:hypothetical protein